MNPLTFSSVFQVLKQKDPYKGLLQSLQLTHKEDVLCFLQYHSARHVLVVRAGVGDMNFENLGIPLSQDKKFDLERMKNPNGFELLKQFVNEALEKSSFFAYPVFVNEDPLGLLVLSSNRSLSAKDFPMEWVEALELIANYRLMVRQLSQVENFSLDTDLLNRKGFEIHAHREVARSRRTERPLSAIVFKVDAFEDLSKSMNGLQIRNWMRAIGKLLRAQSRLNDQVSYLGDGLFGTLLPHTNLEGAKVKARRIQGLVREAELRVGSAKLKFSLSCAINEYPRLCEDDISLVERAIDLVQMFREESNQVLEVQTRPHFQADFLVES